MEEQDGGGIVRQIQAVLDFLTRKRAEPSSWREGSASKKEIHERKALAPCTGGGPVKISGVRGKSWSFYWYVASKHVEEKEEEGAEGTGLCRRGRGRSSSSSSGKVFGGTPFGRRTDHWHLGGEGSPGRCRSESRLDQRGQVEVLIVGS